MEIEILYKDRNIVVIVKPAGMPSQPDLTGDADAMSVASQALFADGEKNRELYLVHRLDRVVGGILVFARNKSYAARLSSLFSSGEIEKEYLAVVEGAPQGGELYDFIYKDARAGKAYVIEKKRAGAKEARLEYEVLSSIEADGGAKSLVKVKLDTGRFHQIRVQFSSRKYPIVGDGKYGSRDNKAKMPALFSSGLSFCVDGKKYEFKKAPNTQNYPWSIFNDDRKNIL